MSPVAGETARTGRRIAAAGFGAALTLPMAGVAWARPILDDGTSPPPPTTVPPTQKPAATSKPAAPAPAPARDATPAPDPRPATPPATPQQYGVNASTFHHLPPDDQQSIRDSYEKKHSPKPAPSAPATPATPATTVAARQPVSPPASPAAPPARPVRGPQVYGMDSFTFHHLPPDDQQSIRELYEKKHAPTPAPATPAPKPDPATPATTVAARQPVSPPAVSPAAPPARPVRGPQVYGMDSFTFHHLPPDDQQSIRESYEKKHSPTPDPATPDGPSTPSTPSTAVAARPVQGPQIYGMSSFTFHHLPPDDQQSIRDSWNRAHGVAPVVPPQPFTPQPGSNGLAIGPGQRTIQQIPFPGSLGFTCSQSMTDDVKGPCGIPRPGQKPEPEPTKPKAQFGVTVDGSVTANRSDDNLDEDGQRRTTLDVTGDLKVTGTAGVDGKTVGVSGSAFAGKSVTYQVTLDSDRAARVASGDEQAPNPYDPRTLRTGEGIELDQKSYRGFGGEVSYRALTAGSEYEQGHKVSAGVQRVDSKTARILVGDEDSVKNTLKLGVGTDDVGVAISASNEFGDGKLKSVDLDLSTPAGWAAYQRFVGGGEVPAVVKPNQAGITDAAQSEKATWSGGTSFDAHLGPASVSFGGTSVEGDVTESHHPDGTVDNTMTARDSNVTLRSTQTTKPDGTDGESAYSLSLKDVDHSELGNLQMVQNGDGQQVTYAHNRDASLSFTAQDLDKIQQDALDTLSWGTDQAGRKMSPSEIKATLQDDPYAVIPTLGGADAKTTMIAGAESPHGVLAALYTAANGNPNEVAELLMRNHMNAGMAHHHNNFDVAAPGTLTVYP